MAYTTYTTQALVCGTFHRNTADCSYRLFTEAAGMLYADGRSVREERSRQRYGLQDFSRIRVSLVKGKYGWRIGSVEPLYNYYHMAANKSARGSVVAVCRLLRRFVQGEEPAPELFTYVTEALETLTQTLSERTFIDQAVAVHILSHLGYVDRQAVPTTLQGASPATIAEHYTPAVQRRLEQLYTQAVSMSHL